MTVNYFDVSNCFHFIVFSIKIQEKKIYRKCLEQWEITETNAGTRLLIFDDKS